MARFLKFKFLIMLKLNFNGGKFKKYKLNFGYFNKLKKVIIKLKGLQLIQFEIENFEHLC